MPPVLAFTPVDFSFGSDPEGARARAPRRSRPTISGPEDGVVTPMLVTCEDDPSQDGCQPSGGGGGGTVSAAPTAYPGWDCAPGNHAIVDWANDLDKDRIRDFCEQALVEAFEPQLIFEAQERYWPREPHYIVETVNGVINIGYLLSFYYDGGKVSHNGDSEIIIVRVSPNGSGWKVNNITTSAHYEATAGWWFDETRTYSYTEYTFSGAHPYIYVSHDHHGLYNTQYRCNQRMYDRCSSGYGDGGFFQPAGLGYQGRTGLRPDNNIGNIATPLVIDPYARFGWTPGYQTDCTYADDPGRPGFECYLRGGNYTPNGAVLYAPDFAGWSGQSGTTPYWSIIQDWGFNDGYKIVVTR